MTRFLLILTAIILFSGCTSKDSFLVRGVINGEKKKVIYISRVDVDKPVLLDSAKISKKGNFTIRVKASFPDFYQLGFSETDFITLLAEPGETIELSFNGQNLYNNYSVTGSEGTAKIKDLDDKLERTRTRLDSISKAYSELSSKPEFAVSGPILEQQYNKLVKDQRAMTIEFIIKNTTSLASIKAIYQKITPDVYVLYDQKDLQFMKIVTDSLKKYYPDSKHVQALDRDFQNELSNMYKARINEITRDLPATKLNPELKDVNGKTIAMSSLRGKYVLLTFWSVQSPDCVKENLRLKELYRQYNKSGFEIYQVNLDENEEAWKKAVSFDELPWVSVREDDPLHPKYALMFNVRALPSNYLFDKNGDIVASNLHDKALSIKLDQLFK
jgi:peroxiredoxin